MKRYVRRVRCSKCGVMWKIDKDADTSKGYICPDCSRARMKREAIENKIDYSVFTFNGAWHGVNGWKREEIM
ncbi:hypothetical protein [Anaerotignum neopropionicum]|uniref:hypothetical protein n=1 Tax=Anaerotignum neopropionicum TaxID=36847 RepID=UPI000825E93E|nr:hypothetical protein [Anaerotignum neopropionicum]